MTSLVRVLNLGDDTTLVALTEERISDYESELWKGVELRKGKKPGPKKSRAESTIASHLLHIQAFLRWAVRSCWVGPRPSRSPDVERGAAR